MNNNQKRMKDEKKIIDCSDDVYHHFIFFL